MEDACAQHVVARARDGVQVHPVPDIDARIKPLEKASISVTVPRPPFTCLFPQTEISA
jgi:hypothetical protein